MTLTSALVSCGGGGSSAPAPSSGPGPGPGPAPIDEINISGTPLPSVVAGTRYCFSPNVTNTGNATLQFTVSNLPGWASYNAATGELLGTPGVGDVGTYSGVEVSVSNGVERETLGPFSIEVVGSAQGTAEVAWTAPTQRTDNSPLMDLAGFNVYWGPDGDSLCNSVRIANPSISTFLVEGLTPASWYFSATAFDSTGVESGFSARVTKTISN